MSKRLITAIISLVAIAGVAIAVLLIQKNKGTDAPQPSATPTETFVRLTDAVSKAPTVTKSPTSTETPTISSTPTSSNTPVPTDTPTPTDVSTPTFTPIPTVTPISTPVPTKEPTKAPNNTVTPVPTKEPTKTPPTVAPTATPTEEPTKAPTPTDPPTPTPTEEPTPEPTGKPSKPAPTPRPGNKTPKVDPETWSATNLPDGFSSEWDLVNYVADFRIKRDIAPSLRRDGLIYESFRLVDSGNYIGSWKVYSCEITTRHGQVDGFKFVISFVVHGGNYARNVVNEVTAVSYTSVVSYYNGRKFKSAGEMSDAELENYLDHFFD